MVLEKDDRLSTSFIFSFVVRATACTESANTVLSWLALSSDKSQELQIRSHYQICKMSLGCVGGGRSWDPRGHPFCFNWAPSDDHWASFGTIGATLDHLTAALVGPQGIVERQVLFHIGVLQAFLGAPQGSSASSGGACEGT